MAAAKDLTVTVRVDVDLSAVTAALRELGDGFTAMADRLDDRPIAPSAHTIERLILHGGD